jgi:hypothetical protein
VDSDLAMQPVVKDSLYMGFITTLTAYKFANIKFTVNGEFEWKDPPNRRLAFSDKDTTYYNAVFDSNIQPRSGTIEVSAKNEIRAWKEVEHGSFTITLTNSSPNQPVELYKVKSNGSEKWISPSLPANSTREVTIPADGYLFIKNFNLSTLTITYKIAE